MEKAVLSCCSSWNPIGLTDVGLKQCVYKLPWHVTRAQWECSGFSIVISPPWEPGVPHPLSGHIGGWVLTVSSCLAVVQAKAFEVALELLFFSVPTGRFQVFPLRSTFEIYLESSCFSHLSGCYSYRSHWTQWLQLLSYRPTSFQWPRYHMPRPSYCSPSSCAHSSVSTATDALFLKPVMHFISLELWTICPPFCQCCPGWSHVSSLSFCSLVTVCSDLSWASCLPSSGQSLRNPSVQCCCM